MLVNNSSDKLSAFCVKYLGLSLDSLIKARDVLHVHIHFVGGAPLFYVTPFLSDGGFDDCQSEGIVPYFLSSYSFSDIVSYFNLSYPGKKFKFLVYEK